MKSKLIKDWKWIKLGELTEISIGKTPPRNNPTFFTGNNIWLSIRDLKNFEVKSSNEQLSQIAIDKFNLKPIKKGTLLMSFKLTLGKLAFAGCDLYTNEAIASLPIRNSFENKLTKKFLYYSLQFIDLEKEVDNAVKGKTLNKSKLKNLDIPLPPIQEQIKIVKILDTILGEIDQTTTLANQNIEKLEQLNASVLDKVFKENNWKEESLENLTTKIGSGSTPRGGRSSYKATGISLIRSMNIHDNGFKEKGLAFIDDEQAKKLSNVTIEENDVLLNITGASVARCCIIPKKYIPARVNQHVSILRCKKDKLLPEFLHLCLISPYYKNKLLISSGGGATREAITKTSLVNFNIKYPSIDKQKEIVKYLANTRSKNQKLIQHYKNKLQSLQDLKKSVLDSAFKGKLKRGVVKVEKEVKVVKFKELYPDPYIRKQRVAQKHKLKNRQVFTTARIIDLHRKHNQKLGHTKTEKINHAIEYLAQFDLGRDPVKNTGGPVDFYYTMQFVEPFAKEKRVFEAIQTYKGYMYYTKGNFDLFVNLSYENQILKAYNKAIDNIIKNFLYLSLREAELYMTVYSGWNNLIIRKENTNLKSIYIESIELWIDKTEKFGINDVKNAIKWLKSKNYIPVGYGKEVK